MTLAITIQVGEQLGLLLQLQQIIEDIHRNHEGPKENSKNPENWKPLDETLKQKHHSHTHFRIQCPGSP